MIVFCDSSEVTSDSQSEKQTKVVWYPWTALDTSMSAKVQGRKKTLITQVSKCTFPLPMCHLAQVSHHLSPHLHFILHLLVLEAKDFFFL